MKKLIAILVILIISSSLGFSQSAKDNLRSAVKNKEYIEASNYISEAISDNPKDLDLHILCGDLYFEIEKLDSALILYRKADDISSNESKVLRKIGRTLSYMGRHQEAIKILNDLVRRKKDDVYNHLELGSAYIKADSLSQAELTITRAREMNRSIPDGWVALGDLYFAQRVYELARTNYEEALSIDEDLTDARVKLATAYYWLANQETDKDLSNELFTRSLKEWNIVTQKDPKNARAFFEQGKILFLAKKWEDAAKSFYQYTQLRPTGSLGRWYMAQSMFELGQCDSAAPQLKIVANEIDTVKNKATLMLAQCFFDQKRYQESVNEYNVLHKTGILDLKDLKRYAAALFRVNDTTNGLKIYEEIITKDTTECLLMYQLGSLMLSMKNYP